MPSIETIELFIKAVETQPHYEVVEKFYTDNASIQENNDPPKIGRALLIENEKRAFDKADKVTSKCIRPYFVNDNLVVINWQFTFEWKNNTITTINEMVLQTWQGEKIDSEHFYFDPNQFKPQPRSNA